MAHLIFDLKNDRAITKPGYGIRYFNNGRGASIALGTILRNAPTRNKSEYLVCTVEHFMEHLDPMVETTNILGTPGNVVMIRKSEKGGCTDPGTERYHSM
jgi:hypothetical protein